jgi:vanillate O-demethylase monooxygenase subunit
MAGYRRQFINPQSTFLENAWYVITESRQLGGELASYRVLGEDILLYRDSGGVPVALEDACPHRKLPLSMGKLVGDVVHCGYHGLQFDAGGNCVGAPTQCKIPANAWVRSYPVVEKYRLIWIWMGDPQLADADAILPVADYDDPAWGLTDGGMLECNCHYLYLVDNLLDPSHVAWVHQSSFASVGTDDVSLEIEETDNGVVVSRWILDIDPPPYYAEMLPFSGKVDRLQYYAAVLPSIAVNIGIYTRAGDGGKDRDLPADSYRMRSYHLITPVDENTTRYHWFQHYNTNTADETVRRRLNDGARSAFEEDRAILEAVHRGMSNKRTPNLDLRLDVGSRLFRKKLAALIDAEKVAAT